MIADGAAGDAIEVDGVTYNLDPTNGFDYQAADSSITKEDLLAAIAADTTNAAVVTLGSALAPITVDIAADDKISVGGEPLKLDGKGEFTLETSEDQTFTVVDGKVLNAEDQQVFVGEDGKLTTEADHAGTRTEDPLAALDKALADVDSLRS